MRVWFQPTEIHFDLNPKQIIAIKNTFLSIKAPQLSIKLAQPIAPSYFWSIKIISNEKD